MASSLTGHVLNPQEGTYTSEEKINTVQVNSA